MVRVKVSEHARSATLKKREAQDKIVALAAQGVPMYIACKQVGRSVQRYYEWRCEDANFARRVDLARMRAKDKTLPGTDFVEFRQTYFDRPTPVHHLRMIEAYERAQPDTLTMILGHPESAKTSVLTDRICYQLGPVDPNFRIAVITEGQDLARKIVGHVASRMTDTSQYAAFIESYGPFKAPDREQAKPWNSDFLTVLMSRNDEKEPSLEARGAGSTLYGGRYDEIHMDDIQSDRNIAQTPQLLRYIRQTVLTRPAKGKGKTFVNGSRVGVGDIYEVMQDEGMVDNLVLIPALTEWLDRDDHYRVGPKGVELVEGCPEVSQWPEYWSMLDLAKRRRKVGEEVWTRTYMQRTVYQGSATFTEAMLDEAKDRDRIAGARAGTNVICTVDPAFDTGVCAFMALGWTGSKLYIIDVLGRTDITRYEDIYAQMAAWSAAYRPSHWIVEQNNFQRGLKQDDRVRDLESKFRFSTEAHQTSRNKNDPVLGVAAMASAFVDGEVSIPWGDESTIGAMGPLVDELRSWRPIKKGITQDRVMALWFGWLWWESQRQVQAGDLRLWRPTWMRSAS